MDKTYKFVGISRMAGNLRVRFSDRNYDVYSKTLVKAGHTDIDFMELMYPMTKSDAIKYLISVNFANNDPEITATLENALVARELRIQPREVRPRVARGLRSTMNSTALRSLAAQLAELADSMDEAAAIG